MEKRELLEAAVRAAGIKFNDKRPSHGGEALYLGVSGPLGERGWWNPLDDDGDALRLAVKLRMGVHFETQFLAGKVIETVEVYYAHEDDKCQCEMHSLDADPAAALRGCITRAAAAIDAQRRESNG